MSGQPVDCIRPAPSALTGPIRASKMDVTFGHNVANHRIAAGLDQYTLADTLTATTSWTWHQNVISRIELGKRPIRLSEAYALAAVFDVSVDALTEQGQSSPKTQAFSQLAEVHRMQTMLRQRERQIVTELKNTTKRTKK